MDSTRYHQQRFASGLSVMEKLLSDARKAGSAAEKSVMFPETVVFTTKPMVSMAVKIVFVVQKIVFASEKIVFGIEKIVFASEKIVFVVEKIVFAPEEIVFAIEKMVSEPESSSRQRRPRSLELSVKASPIPLGVFGSPARSRPNRLGKFATRLK